MIRFISHRGNIDGPCTMENSQSLIEFSIYCGFDVEVDIWEEDGKLYLGHDKPTYDVDTEWLDTNRESLLCHAKNIEAGVVLEEMEMEWFAHSWDAFVSTSMGGIIIHPRARLVPGCIIMMPEKRKKTMEFSTAYGICSDYIELYRGVYQNVVSGHVTKDQR